MQSQERERETKRREEKRWVNVPKFPIRFQRRCQAPAFFQRFLSRLLQGETFQKSHPAKEDGQKEEGRPDELVHTQLDEGSHERAKKSVHKCVLQMIVSAKQRRVNHKPKERVSCNSFQTDALVDRPRFLRLLYLLSQHIAQPPKNARSSAPRR